VPDPSAGAAHHSLAFRLHGWPDEGTAVEQRLKDGETFVRGYRRRWLVIAGVFVAGLTGALLDFAAVPPSTMAATAGVAATVNAGVGFGLRRGWYRWWLIYGLALLDVAIAAALVVWFGPGGVAVGLLLAVLPYAFDQEHATSGFLLLAAAVAYLAAAGWHTRLTGAAAFPPRAWFEAGLLFAVAFALQRLPSALIARIRQVRTVMGEAEHGFLAVRAPAVAGDELGFLERSLNRMLEEIGTTISAVQREADEVAAFAEQLAASAQQLHATSETVSTTARALATALGDQRGVADASRGESAKAANQADALRTRAELMQSDASRLTGAADRGRERVERASRTLRDVGDEVRATAASISGLAGMSQRIAGFARTIARIARQTHLLALNAAIEAAHAGEHGEGFAVVADEVRGLAAEAGRSAREVAELVSDLSVGIDAAVRAMQAGETKVRDVGAVASEAEDALREIQHGVQLMGDLVDATAEVSHSQAQRLAELAQSLDRVASISTLSAGSADGAAAATQAQIAAMGDLTVTSQQLAELATRLRGSIARFSVLRRDQATAEHRVAQTAAD
jgi:methyl-accepting chemotaxis protein